MPNKKDTKEVKDVKKSTSTEKKITPKIEVKKEVKVTKGKEKSDIKVIPVTIKKSESKKKEQVKDTSSFIRTKLDEMNKEVKEKITEVKENDKKWLKMISTILKWFIIIWVIFSFLLNFLLIRDLKFIVNESIKERNQNIELTLENEWLKSQLTTSNEELNRVRQEAQKDKSKIDQINQIINSELLPGMQP